jgi:hypothetical protein
MIPIPPHWISTRITNCPNQEKSLPVDRTVSPVTQVALVAVNSASSQEIGAASSARQNGMHQKQRPAQDQHQYQMNDVRAGCLTRAPMTLAMIENTLASQSIKASIASATARRRS